MALPRCVLQSSRNYLSRCYLLQSKFKQSYCELHHKYSSDAFSIKFTDRHEWVTVDKEKNIGTVGISKYAEESLGDVVFAQLPDPGTKLLAGDECGALESVKAASEIYSPVSGTVTEKNSKVENQPALINTSCYDDGWLFKLKLSKPHEIDELMDEIKYEEFLKTDVENDHT